MMDPKMDAGMVGKQTKRQVHYDFLMFLVLIFFKA